LAALSRGETGIEIQGLVKAYGELKAVDDLTLSIKKGELFGLLGPNGSGKTTTINCLNGLVRPTAGRMSVGGYDVGKETAKVRAISGLSPQETAVYPFLTGRENIELFGELYSVSGGALRSKVDYVIDKVGLAEDARRRVSTYSGGTKRRVSIAMALIQDPEFLFLDEPTVAMDPQSRRAVWDFVRELKSRGKTILLTTHYMEEAEELCDRVGIIDHGRLIALGTPSELKARYQAKTLEDVFIGITGRTIREGA
jgi:ABC-2 type transport system ATP-binding protein